MGCMKRCAECVKHTSAYEKEALRRTLAQRVSNLDRELCFLGELFGAPQALPGRLFWRTFKIQGNTFGFGDILWLDAVPVLVYGNTTDDDQNDWRILFEQLALQKRETQVVNFHFVCSL